ncbi:hypothetical protein A1QO_02845 [Vibrio genomosp. F10 str. ZF-129]|uniref:Integrating conjugative element protein n=1 Tax=Vibrio genomosp. F10 str. ZF-129 TaxID=1187848 RepID=A0A1E5BKE4_9VIBR|nr:hypothetical protein [Vibrio genomosp. F10]OEE38334.1 hypothetical protein A1QO_02845 [Vibrio genomosp. F10 str. ZF-129]
MKTLYAPLLFSVLSFNVLANTINLPVLTTNPTGGDASTVIDKLGLDPQKVVEFERQQWGLTKEEWRNYLFYKNTTNTASVYLDTASASPYRVLFSFAKTKEEKYDLALRAHHYYKEQLQRDNEFFLLMEMAGEDVDQTASSNSKAETAPSRLNEFGSLRMPHMSASKKTRSLLFFEIGQCDRQCSFNVRDSIENIKDDQQFEIFISSSGTVGPEQVVQFSEKYGVTKNMIDSKRVVFHVDKGESKQIGVRVYPTLVVKDFFGSISVMGL